MKRLLIFFINVIAIQIISAQGLTFEGKVGGRYGIVVYLNPLSNGQLSGWCYYTSQGPDKKITLTGNYTEKSYNFYEVEGGRNVGLFKCLYDKSTQKLTGSHQNLNTDKILYVELTSKRSDVIPNTPPSTIRPITGRQLDWQKGYYKDDFGEDILESPFIETKLPGKLYLGSSSSPEYVRLSVQLNYRFIVFRLLSDHVSNFASNERMTIRVNNKDFTVPISVEEGMLFIDDRQNINALIELLKQGNFSIALVGDSFLSHRCRFDVGTETMNIINNLRFVEVTK